MKIYTEAYSPFITGGDVNQPICTEIGEPNLGPFDLGKGASVYLVQAPDGRGFVVCAVTGGLLGQSLASVKEDVKTASKAAIKKSILEAKARSEYARPVKPEEFWGRLR